MPELRAPHVLIVEPDQVLATTYARALQQSGFSATHSATAQDAIHACDTAQPDVIVLELQLVEHSGIEFLYELRSYADWRQIPVVAQTCVPPEEFANNWQLLRDELRVVKYLYKPHSRLKDLLASVQEQLAVVA